MLFRSANLAAPSPSCYAAGKNIKPKPNIKTQKEIYAINRGILRSSYGWGVEDRTLPFEWSDCCPGGEGAHPPNCKSCGDPSLTFLGSIYDDNLSGSARWLTCCPPCEPIPPLGPPDDTAPVSPQIMPLAHDPHLLHAIKEASRLADKPIISRAYPAIREEFYISLPGPKEDKPQGIIISQVSTTLPDISEPAQNVIVAAPPEPIRPVEPPPAVEIQAPAAPSIPFTIEPERPTRTDHERTIVMEIAPSPSPSPLPILNTISSSTNIIRQQIKDNTPAKVPNVRHNFDINQRRQRRH